MMNVLRQRLRNFAAERDWDRFHSPKNLAMALSVEVAEVAEHFQWLTQEQSRSLTPEKLALVKEEIADVLIYLVRFADVLGVDLLEAAEQKVRINELKYPADRVHGRADKYTEYESSSDG